MFYACAFIDPFTGRISPVTVHQDVATGAPKFD